MASRLAHIAQAHQVGQQAVHRAARDVELVRHGGEFHAFAVL
ncbi:hypothetical protein Y695_04751 [Hydrogenophaga sp. T4]|nr:hypothetical protein Y695_04751 [Hydrogenophaga sp. T4]